MQSATAPCVDATYQSAIGLLRFAFLAQELGASAPAQKKPASKYRRQSGGGTFLRQKHFPVLTVESRPEITTIETTTSHWMLFLYVGHATSCAALRSRRWQHEPFTHMAGRNTKKPIQRLCHPAPPSSSNEPRKAPRTEQSTLRLKAIC